VFITRFLATCLITFATAAGAQQLAISETLRIGGDVEVTEPVEGSLHAAAGRVRVDAPVEGSVRLAGGRIEVGPGAVISRDASLAGGHLTTEGSILGNLHAAGGTIRIDGPVGGDASVAGGTLELGPNARIGGKLTFRGGSLKRDPAAQVAGTVEHIRKDKPRHEASGAWRFIWGWISTSALVVLAALVAAALPGPSQRMAAELRERPWMIPLLGLIALTCIPVAAVILMVTVIGIPFGLLAMVGYAVLLLLGYVWLSVVLGGLLLDRYDAAHAARTAYRMAAAALVMLMLALLVRIPLVGGFFTVAALVVGVGMIVAALSRHFGPKPAAVSV
jgi:cytoskeletal protein CcmA (bactofilin family)